MTAPSKTETGLDIYTIRLEHGENWYMAANFAEASSEIWFAAAPEHVENLVDIDGSGDESEWSTTGKQVADFGHDPWAAAFWIVADDDTVISVD